MPITEKHLKVLRHLEESIDGNRTLSFDFTDYYNLAAIYKNLDDLAKQHPDKVQIIAQWARIPEKCQKIYFSTVSGFKQICVINIM
ncbi:uncharacterized protein LOC105187944 isoform X2 [Harpegnathos saltator]|uniref:uncharacterized protein LOC105187944 isoform X2 n=1 Tax=Harpegnathos saltator TaxID=610380 RepID=UPI000DBEF1B0|nr:uncharacterized protein LOC105187944 isoform X2 [Harpegnathos saltator]